MGNCVGEKTWEDEGQSLKHLECIKTTSQGGHFTRRFIRQAARPLFVLVTCGVASC